jgi:uncharacterized protein YdaU (DUF1376 family)
MGKLRWYKRDPNAALAGMMELTLEERGAYNTVLDLLYARDGDLDDEPHFIAGWLRCDLRVWKRIRQRLIDTKKLYILDGKIRNRRADDEVLSALHRVASAEEAGRISGTSRRHKSSAAANENNGLGRTAVPTERERNPELTTTTSTEDKGETPLKPPRAAAQPKAPAGTRLSPEWDLSAEDLQFALNEGLTHDDARRELGKFRDYWASAVGARARKSDWPACWRNWVRKAADDRGRVAGRPRSNGGGSGGDGRARDRQTGRLADTLAVLHRRGSLEGLGVH